MKLKVLGYQSPYPGYNQATLGYIIEDKQGTKVLLECGSGIVSSLQKWMEPAEIDAVFLSHYHFDHVADLGVLQYSFLMNQLFHEPGKVIKVHGPSEPEDKASQRVYKEVTTSVDIHEGAIHQVGNLTFTYFLTDHDGPCYGMIITEEDTTIIYGADSGNETCWPIVTTVPDLVILESTYLDQDKNASVKHLSAKEAAEIASALQAKRLLLTHLYPKIDPQRYYNEAKQYFSNELILPEKGLELILS